jgi:RimJ/RimL family protein N-acetyltransferase
VAYAFDNLQLARLAALTTADNEASMGVMRKLGMALHRNPLPDPEWLQVVGVLNRVGPL